MERRPRRLLIERRVVHLDPIVHGVVGRKAGVAFGVAYGVGVGAGERRAHVTHLNCARPRAHVTHRVDAVAPSFFRPRRRRNLGADGDTPLRNNLTLERLPGEVVHMLLVDEGACGRGDNKDNHNNECNDAEDDEKEREARERGGGSDLLLLREAVESALVLGAYLAGVEKRAAGR